MSLGKSSVILFDESKSAIRGEYILKKRGFLVTLVAPPEGVRKGCDLSVKVGSDQQLQAVKVLDRERIDYIGLAAFTGGASPVELTTAVDFGRFIMVKSGNMKLTFSKEDGGIVNSSGGGCPDIPYLAGELLNKKLSSIDLPLEGASSLCAYLLERALREAKKYFEA